MSQSYRIDRDVVAGILSVTLNGFFSVDDIAAMRFDLIVAIKELGRRPGDHASLYDIRECKIQSQGVVSALRAMSDVKGVVARRIAVVTGSSLMRMQLPRIVVDREVQYFDDLQSARGWLVTSCEARRPKHAA